MRRLALSAVVLTLTSLTVGAAWAEPPAGSDKAAKGGGVASFDDPQAAPAPGTDSFGAPDAPPKPKPRPKRRKKPVPKPAPPPALAPGLMAGLTPGALSPGAPPPLPPFTDWKPLDAENTLVIETQKGVIIVELRPDMAPASVEQVKKLARRGVYDGLLFHRVIDGFVDQTGNPNNKDGGKSDAPNLPPEFTFRLGADTPHVVAARPNGESTGFIGATPYAGIDEARMVLSPDHRVAAWGAYCPGVMGMGRDEAPDSGNSEIFFMRDTARRLDRDYTVVGRAVAGLNVIRAINVGEPPMHPDAMVRVHVLGDLPDRERPRLMILNTQGMEFRALIDRTRALKGADFSVCDVEIPVKPG